MAKPMLIIEGHKEIIERFNRSEKIISDIGMAHLRHLGNFTVEEVKRHTLNAGSVDTNELIQGIHQKIKAKGNTVTSVIKPSEKADKYAIFVEFGTKPHRAPIDALRGWAERHGIPVGAVWHSIATKGTKPRWMWRDSFEQVKKRVNSTAQDIANEIERKI